MDMRRTTTAELRILKRGMEMFVCKSPWQARRRFPAQRARARRPAALSRPGRARQARNVRSGSGFSPSRGRAAAAEKSVAVDGDRNVFLSHTRRLRPDVLQSIDRQRATTLGLEHKETP
jgi:hypothetical protein